MKKDILYLECYSGISGDMTVAALLDLGADEEVLKKGLKSLKLDEFKIKIGRVKKCGIDACDFNVIIKDKEYKVKDLNNDENKKECCGCGCKNCSDPLKYSNLVKKSIEENCDCKREFDCDEFYYDSKLKFDCEEKNNSHKEGSDGNISMEIGHKYERDGHRNEREDQDYKCICHNHEHHGHKHGHHNHDHEHYGHDHEHHNHDHEHYGHDHEHHDHDHEHHDHDHEHHSHRGINEITSIIDNSEISSNAKKIAKKIFNIIAKAESKAHGIPEEMVHFHEVGAVDSIVDIVSTAICIDNLDIEDIVISSISEGQGFVKCQHGNMPVPVPAVVNILQYSDIPLNVTENYGEMVTPTGAAIAAALNNRKLPKQYKINKVGMGAGKKDFKNANVVRALIIEEIDSTKDENVEVAVLNNKMDSVSFKYGNDSVYILECNVDDMTGEELGYALDKIMDEGALDGYFTPIYMKKNRPAYKLSVICKDESVKLMTKLILKHTTSLGVRMTLWSRVSMDRNISTIETSLGKVDVKDSSYEDIFKRTVEYKSAKKIAEKNDISVNEAFRKIYNEISK